MDEKVPDDGGKRISSNDLVQILNMHQPGREECYTGSKVNIQKWKSKEHFWGTQYRRVLEMETIISEETLKKLSFLNISPQNYRDILQLHTIYK